LLSENVVVTPTRVLVPDGNDRGNELCKFPTVEAKHCLTEAVVGPQRDAHAGPASRHGHRIGELHQGRCRRLARPQRQAGNTRSLYRDEHGQFVHVEEANTTGIATTIESARAGPSGL